MAWPTYLLLDRCEWWVVGGGKGLRPVVFLIASSGIAARYVATVM